MEQDSASGGRRLRVAVLFGGRSAEHEVSVHSAATVIAALDRSRFEPVPVAISRDGRWRQLPAAALKGLGGEPERLHRLLAAWASAPGEAEAPAGAPPEEGGEGVALLPAEGARLLAAGGVRPLPGEGGAGAGGLAPGRWDVVFPVLHGPFGEDGSIQGLLEVAGIPYVGAGVTASALAMDKALTKDVLRAHGLPVLPFLLVRRDEEPGRVAERVEKELGYPVFVKPANLGSSVGISRVDRPERLPAALQRAGRYDLRLVVERAIPAREIECSVLGNSSPEASLPGEIVPHRSFYDYRAKYLEEGSALLIPAPLDRPTTERVRQLAVEAYRALGCEGMARVDFLMERGSGRLYVNELNTIPGFTSISMYPKLWEATGLPLPKLLERLIELALERHRLRAGLSLLPDPDEAADAAGPGEPAG
ncbi:MAG: D-alanine--D-alanine ligase family protein [Bacillota bacterium]|nr:D-alanine--D-alanine ligase family protein [Bacillota bacterium]